MRQRYKKIVSILLIFLLFFQWIPSTFADFTLATPPSVNYKAVAYGDGKYVVTDTTGKAYYSTNGSSWTQSTIITALQTINSVVYENNHFMAVDNSSNFYTSSDGQTWTTATSVDSSTPLHSVTYGYNKYVTVGNLGNMYVSSNGVTWQKKTPQTNHLYGVIYANNQFVAVGAGGTILTSPDGENWLLQTSNTKNILRSVIYANGQYVVVGQNGTILTSPDGVYWTIQYNLPVDAMSFLLTSVSYGNGHYVTVAASGKVYYSKDGINWYEQAVGLGKTILQGVTYGNGQFVVVGNSGTILYGNPDVPTQAPAVITLTPATNITSTGATVGGEVTFDGGAEITERGIVYSTSTEPTTENSEKVTAIGTTGAFSVDLSGLNPSSTYYYRAYAKNSVGTSYGENEMFETLTVLPELGGTVSITGEAKYDGVLTADISGITYTPTTTADVPTYQWYRGNTVIPGATSFTYTLVEADIGEKLKVTVSADGTHATGSVTSGATATVEKANGPSAPSAPTEASKTPTSITLNGVAGQEYSRDNGTTWQDSPIFSGLTPDMEYMFITRVRETATHKASSVSIGTPIQTQPVAIPVIGGTVSIAGETKYGSMLTADISGITYTSTTIEDVPTYQWYRGNTAISGATSPTYTLVQADIGETLKVTVTADGTNATGSITSGETAFVEKADGPSAPPAPTEASTTSTSITLNGVVGQEYSKDNGATWQDSLIFNGLIPETEYTFITRVKETPTHKASLVSTGTSIQTQTQTVAVPEMGGTISITGETKYGSVLTADISGITYTPPTTADAPTYEWYRGNTAISGANSSTYMLVQADIGETIKVRASADGTNATGSVMSGETTIVEKADGPSAPPVPTVASKTATNITLNGVVGQEYSRDNGTTWQDSPIFSELTPDTEYTFITRVKETATHKASLVSAGTLENTSVVSTFTITYNGNTNTGGTVPTDSETYEQGETVTVLGNIGNLVKVGYTFEGWNTQADGRGIDYASASTVLMGSGNIILYAKWNPVTVTHMVSFDVAGGSAVSNQMVVHEGKAGQPTPAPTKAGYTFGGWYTSNAYTTPYNFNTLIIANTVIYAKWISNNTGGGNTDPSPNPDSGSSTPSTNVEEIVVDVESGNGDVVSKTTIKRAKNVDNTMNDDVTLTAASATETIRKLKEQGNDKARIIIPDEKDQVNQVKVSIPKNVLSILQIGAVHLEIVTDKVRIEVPKTSLEMFNENLYFRLVPIKGHDKQLEIEEQAKRETVVQQLVEGGVVKLLGRPMTIETNMQSLPVKLTLPLPTDLTDGQLANLAIFIEHSDGTKEVVRGKIVEYQKGIGLQFEVNKFSTFSILYLPEKEEVKEPITEGVTHLPYIQGYPDDTFRPNAPVTRAQMASMFARQLTGNAIPQAKATYTDTFQHDAKDAIEFAKEKGLFKGVTATNFNPNGFITRAQMATVAARWIEQQCIERPDADFCSPTSQSAVFKDVSVHHWARQAIDTVNAAEIMTGITADTFNPDGFLTRAQAVKVLNRLFERQVLIEDQTPLFKDVPKHHWAFYEIQEAAKK
ncbi:MULTISPECIES: S-layer homology domain-containing protein [Lysinibacillus]|uniref:S-layer homology domain-containing protein n=1 Tax=Lysinibacillus TaxID=400634 RepID=UPI0021A4B7CD|nr:S-layer homology domain-containing protein [Lysinibacillus capsici]MCT1541907.1 S-layer homology domain-containing protein [Lysinibacillus capsici]MCT1573143.1 S-layer homology domain-containing protein [Lysinibacillus capsici]MCT1650155.1 S-layer homology domain-containing protein [Lysinibacillus capsici]MCT1728539.1 S-layer homology domain-containing protein [Lysinibacillus capsici]MCT1786317.1 S-layer homology domain-containing protein [Lysinibacillus capsici]